MGVPNFPGRAASKDRGQTLILCRSLALPSVDHDGKVQRQSSRMVLPGAQTLIAGWFPPGAKTRMVPPGAQDPSRTVPPTRAAGNVHLAAFWIT